MVVGAGDVVLLGIAEDEDVLLPAVGLPPGVDPALVSFLSLYLVKS